MATDGRAGSDSRCCFPDNAPYVWRDFRDHDHPAALELESWLQSLAPFARLHEEGEIEELMQAAARGELWDSGDETTAIKPILADPEVFELRRKALNKPLRFYHGEPAEMPLMLVQLHSHIKSSSSPQQAAVEYAAQRFNRGRPLKWVMPTG